MKEIKDNKPSLNQKENALFGKQETINKPIVFIIVAFSLLMTTIDTTIVATALETLSRELKAPINWVGWTITAYSFGFVLMLPMSAKLTQRFGSRKLFLLSIFVFTIASLLCGVVNTISWLIPLRVVQAVGAAGITPSVTAIIVNHFGSSRDRAVSLFGSIFPIGVMLGPIFGGLFVTYWNWRWIFFVNVPIGIIVIWSSLKYIPKDPPNSRDKSKLDFIGLMWLGLGLLSGMFGATYLGQAGSHVFSVYFIGLVLISIGCLWLFFRHVNKIKNPFILPRFIYGKGFGVVNLLNVLYTGSISGVLSLVPLFAANRYGINALDSGTLLIAQGAASVLFSTIMTMLLRRTGYRPPLYIGCSIIFLGTLLLSFQPLMGVSPYVWLMLATTFIGIGMGIISPPARNAGLQLAPEESATIAALRSLSLQLGSIISVAIATAIIAGKNLPGEVHSKVYFWMAIMFLVSIPLIRRIPEHKGSW